MALMSQEVSRLLSAGPERLPLTRAALRPGADVCKVTLRDAAILFPSARRPQAAFAGLLFRIGCWEESHEVAQEIASTEGSYWHGMLHRIEPDSSNARYWFGRVGAHPIFPELARHAGEILQNGSPKNWRIKGAWNPFQFIEWCEEARERGGDAENAAVEIQMAEWRLLFDWCVSGIQR